MNEKYLINKISRIDICICCTKYFLSFHGKFGLFLAVVLNVKFCKQKFVRPLLGPVIYQRNCVKRNKAVQMTGTSVSSCELMDYI